VQRITLISKARVFDQAQLHFVMQILTKQRHRSRRRCPRIQDKVDAACFEVGENTPPKGSELLGYATNEGTDLEH
jgi:hypothetical protein